MREYDERSPASTERGVATVRLADFETRAASSVSWREVQIDRREIPLPRPERAPRPSR